MEQLLYAWAGQLAPMLLLFPFTYLGWRSQFGTVPRGARLFYCFALATVIAAVAHRSIEWMFGSGDWGLISLPAFPVFGSALALWTFCDTAPKKT